MLTTSEADYIIRPTEPNEAGQVIDYMKTILSETSILSMDPEEFTFTVDEEIAVIKKYGQSVNMLMLSAIYKGEIIGMLTYGGGSRRRNKHTGVVGLSVKKEHWGQGIGGQLLTDLFDWAKNNGVTKKINLGVREDNHRAIELYNRLGFKVYGKESMAQKTDGRYYSNLLMEKLID
ncbi:GNAT family N-acetyltransferase [Fusibacter sp. JL216-2]|uniref:GNAT family N-acetyltransferase n=1 Tax=Fusibacter sp. JL216-2 TaxID=3071453 RepID=UPI003D32CCF4